MAKIGLQLYSIKEIASKNFLGAIELAAGSGYKGVEFAGFFDTPAKEVMKCLESNNISPCGSHTSIDLITDEFDKTVEYNLAIGNEYIVIPWIPEEMRNSRDSWLSTAERLNALNEKLKKNNLKLGYHNHAFEFEEFNGEYGFDILAENTSDDIILEMDLYWVEYPGLSAVEYVKKYRNRLELLHIKDLAEDRTSTEIGNGKIDFAKIVEAADATEWFIVEQEHFIIPQDKSIKISSEYLGGLIK
ncbi:MAG: sugar phosphate isomerase/epimerase [Clostridia bacterium]|nr:sugar phosphate isomerase/epimerase [Clostridia bacterium]MBN2883079.1 sugar phosphate isomerase/epimerase [Clostridia bacterium]